MRNWKFNEKCCYCKLKSSIYIVINIRIFCNRNQIENIIISYYLSCQSQQLNNSDYQCCQDYDKNIEKYWYLDVRAKKHRVIKKNDGVDRQNHENQSIWGLPMILDFLSNTQGFDIVTLECNFITKK